MKPAPATSQFSVSQVTGMPSDTACLIDREPGRTGRRLHGSIERMLGQGIIGGEFKEGSNLPGEIEFARRLNVSRSAYREAVRLLVGKGLLECRPQSGVRVQPRSKWNLLDPDVLRWALAGPRDEKLVYDLRELRLMIEPDAARLAALRRTTTDLVLLSDCVAALERRARCSDAKEVVANFHVCLLKATRNDAMVTLATGISVAIAHAYPFLWEDRLTMEELQGLYSRLLDAIRSQSEGGASGAMHSLLATLT